MTVYSSFEEASRTSQIREVSLGFFDGLHLGHRQVITGTRPPSSLTESAVVTFQDHPQSVLCKEHPVTLITGQPHKADILKRWGINHLILLPFNLEISKKNALTFLEELTTSLPGLRTVRVGENFRFGHQRQGTPDLLKTWGKENGVGIEVIPSLLLDHSPISSSRIRNFLINRNLIQASALLGRHYSLFGQVIEGQKIGARLGFPTANLLTEDGELLPYGVYRGRAHLDNGQSYPAAINIGTRPTVTSDKKLSIEAHLLDFEGELYGKNLHLEFFSFLREEQKFPSKEALIGQLQQDIEKIRLSA